MAVLLPFLSRDERRAAFSSGRGPRGRPACVRWPARASRRAAAGCIVPLRDAALTGSGATMAAAAAAAAAAQRLALLGGGGRTKEEAPTCAPAWRPLGGMRPSLGAPRPRGAAGCPRPIMRPPPASTCRRTSAEGGLQPPLEARCCYKRPLGHSGSPPSHTIVPCSSRKSSPKRSVMENSALKRRRRRASETAMVEPIWWREGPGGCIGARSHVKGSETPCRFGRRENSAGRFRPVDPVEDTRGSTLVRAGSFQARP